MVNEKKARRTTLDPAVADLLEGMQQRQAEAPRAAALPGRKPQLLNDLPDESHL